MAFHVGGTVVSLIFGGTLSPFENETFMLGAYTAEGEAKRVAVNEWIRTAGAFHAVIDFDKGLRDPDHHARMLPLYFALVGCLSLPVNRGVAALIVPDVEDLTEFMYDRPAMTPSTATDCQIANAADAGFRAQVRVRDNPRRDAEVKLRARTAPACYAMTFTPTAWASQQKSRVATIQVPRGDSSILDRYV